MVLRCTEKELRELTNNIGFEWKELGTHLNIQNARIQHFSMNNAGDVGNAIFCMLNEWQQRRLADTSCNIMNELADAFTRIGRADIAEVIRGFHGTTDSIPSGPFARGDDGQSRIDDPDSGPVDKRKRENIEADETARKKLKASGLKHVMISYKRESRERMLMLRDELRNAGFQTWMDVDDLRDNMYDAMSFGVDHAYAVLLCFSKLYKESDFCKEEAQYARNQNKLIIPLKYEDYKPDGWLGIMINSLVYHNVQTNESMMEVLPSIIELLRVQRAKTLEQQDEDDVLSSEAIPIQATDDTTSAVTSMARSSPDVIEVQDDTGTDEPDTGIKIFTKDDFVHPLMPTKNIIGSGGYAKVYKLTMKNGSQVAGKKILNFKEKNRREISILAKLDHRNVVKMYGCIDDKDNDCFMIVMEKADMSLKEYLEKPVNFQNKPYNPVLLKQWMHEVCDAIQYLHGRAPLPVVHRDIRGANCLLFGNEYFLKLADFGLSKETDHTTETPYGIGTGGYKAPELCRPYLKSAEGKPCFSVKSDIYALGMLFYEMYTGHVPQPRHDHEGRAIYNQPIEDPIFNNIRGLLQVCWQKDYKARPNIEEVQDRLP